MTKPYATPGSDSRMTDSRATATRLGAPQQWSTKKGARSGTTKACETCGKDFYCVASVAHKKFFCSRRCMGLGHTARATARFWERVEKEGHNGCWIWTGPYRHDGYGHVRIGGKGYGAHKFAYIQRVGHVPAGMWVLHSCDVRGCCNPEHLRLGTRADNMRDAMDRRRIKGEQDKLTPDDVRAIRRDFHIDGRGYSNAHALAKHYRVHRNTIHRVGTHRIYKDIT